MSDVARGQHKSQRVRGWREVTNGLFICQQWVSLHGWRQKKRVFGCPREKDFLHRMNFKAPEKLYEGEPLIRPFLARQPHLALAGAKMCCADVREGWREPVRASENTTGEIRVTSLRYSLLFTPPRHTAQSHATIFPFSSSPSIAVRRQPR
jgi:hypothetical protein